MQTACVDTRSIYEEANELSISKTGATTSIDTIKRNDLAANLIMYTSILYGSDIFCDVAETSSTSSIPVSTRTGILGTLDSQIGAMLINPPSVDLGGHLSRQFIPGAEGGNADIKTLAQEGEGFKFLRDNVGLEQVWMMFRDIAYSGFVVVIMISGFAIMFRSKLSGGTTVSVLNTLPRIMLGLILVTFSFAIVGFIMDVSKLLMYVIWQYMDGRLGGYISVGLSGLLGTFKDAFTASYPTGSADFTAGILKIAGAIAVLYSDMDTGIPGAESAADLALNVAKAVSSGLLLWGIIDLLKVIVVAIVCIYAALRLFMTIILTYLKLFVEVILGPLYILLGTLPGNSGTISSWIRRVAAHCLTFVLIFLIINLTRYIGLSSTDTSLTFYNTSDVLSDWIVSMKGIIIIGGYLIAAGAPGIVEELLQASSSKAVTSAVDDAKKAVSKVPLVGGLFGG